MLREIPATAQASSAVRCAALGHHGEDVRCRQRKALRGEIGADMEIEFIDARLESIAFQQGAVAAAVLIRDF